MVRYTAKNGSGRFSNSRFDAIYAINLKLFRHLFHHLMALDPQGGILLIIPLRRGYLGQIKLLATVSDGIHQQLAALKLLQMLTVNTTV